MRWPAPLTPAAKSLWGYGGAVQAPDGTIWKVATPAKEDTGPATGQTGQTVLLLAAAEVAAGTAAEVGPAMALAKDATVVSSEVIDQR